MKRFMIDDLYEILGVFRDATPEQIRSRYLALRIADENVRLPTTWFAEIKRAYSTLSNPVQREISDNLDKVDFGDLNFMTGIEKDSWYNIAVRIIQTERFL